MTGFSTNDPYVIIRRDNVGRIVACDAVHGKNVVSLPISTVEFDWQAQSIGSVKIGLVGARVRFLEAPDEEEDA
jgi:hypothetical protein